MREGCAVINMLDKRRIRLMTKAAIYEKKCAEEDIRISSYYKKDYASLNTWVTQLWVTAGYLLAAVLVLICAGDVILESLTIIKLIAICAVAVCIYLALLIVYGIGAGRFYKRKHTRAKQRVKKYYRDLSRIEKLYKKENDRS